MKYSRLYKSIAIVCLGSLGAQAAWPQAFNLFQPATGVLVGSAATYVTTAAASTDIVSLWTGTCNATSFLRGDGSCQTTGTVTSITAGTGLTGGTITTSGTIALSTPVSATNGGTGVAGTLTGVLKGNGAGAHTVAVQSDLVALATPAADVNSLGFGTGSLTQGGITGVNNTAFGQGTLQAITSGLGNTAVGYQANLITAAGNNNTSVGSGALQGVTGGGANVAVGHNAGASIGNGASNTMVGNAAGVSSANVSNNTLVGANAGGSLTSGAGNVIVGTNGNLTTGSNNIVLGNSLTKTTAASSNQIDIGDILFLNNTSTAVPVISSCGTSPSVDANANNHSGTVTVGTVAAASCTITFASAYASFIHCRVTSQAIAANFAYSYTTAAITVTATSLVSDKIDYDCDGL